MKPINQDTKDGLVITCVVLILIFFGLFIGFMFNSGTIETNIENDRSYFFAWKLNEPENEQFKTQHNLTDQDFEKYLLDNNVTKEEFEKYYVLDSNRDNVQIQDPSINSFANLFQLYYRIEHGYYDGGTNKDYKLVKPLKSSPEYDDYKNKLKMLTDKIDSIKTLQEWKPVKWREKELAITLWQTFLGLYLALIVITITMQFSIPTVKRKGK